LIGATSSSGRNTLRTAPGITGRRSNRRVCPGAACAERRPTVATLNIADQRVTELQEALQAALQASSRLQTMMRELARVDEALQQACEAIYNATLYDPAGERDDA